MPLRLTVSPRNLKDGNAELKLRTMKDAETIPLSGVISRALALLRTPA
jgi:hypothetical protein